MSEDPLREQRKAINEGIRRWFRPSPVEQPRDEGTGQFVSLDQGKVGAPASGSDDRQVINDWIRGGGS
jgi:hypothetical protein